jgi:hypothetical protein
MLYCDRPSAGAPSWDLHDYFAEQTFEILGESYDFWETSIAAHRSMIEPVCESHGFGAPADYRIAMGVHGYDFGLSYGWPGSTFHQSHQWDLGKWRQDMTEKGEWSVWADIHESRQFVHLDEIRHDTEKELARIIARWEHYQRTGHYPLQWGEVASLLASIRRQWDDPKSLPLHGAHDDFHLYLSGNRGGSFQLLVVAEGRPKHPLRLTAARDHIGWRFDVFAPYSVLGECPWYEAIVMSCDYQANTAALRCPLPHKTPHEMVATRLNPWDMKREVLEVLVSDVIRLTPSQPYPNSVLW